MKRRMDIPEELELILNHISNNRKNGKLTSLKEIGVLSGYGSYASQKGWALYRVQLLVSELKIKKPKRGRYDIA